MYARASFDSLKNLNLIREKMCDLKLITVNDYTAEVKIDSNMFRKFKISSNLGPDDKSIQLFEEELSRVIEDQLVEQRGISREDAEIADL